MKVVFYYSNGKTYTLNEVSWIEGEPPLDKSEFICCVKDIESKSNRFIKVQTQYLISKSDLVALSIYDKLSDSVLTYRYAHGVTCKANVTGYGH